MAFNEIQVGRFNRFFQKIAGIKGAAPVPSLGAELMPVQPVFSGVEDRYLQSWNRFGIAAQIGAGGVGTFVKVRLRNPLGSNVIVVVEKISFSVNIGTAGDAPCVSVIRPATTDLGTPLSSFVVNFDARGNPTPTLQVSSEATAGALPGAQFVCIGAGSATQAGTADAILTENQEVPISPGSAIQMQATTANVAGDYNFFWRERFLEEPERQ